MLSKGDELRRLAVRVRDRYGHPDGDRSPYLLAVNALEMLDEIDSAVDKAERAISDMEADRDKARAIGKEACDTAAEIAKAQLAVIDQRDQAQAEAADLRAEVENDRRHTRSLMDEFLRTAAERDAMREAAKVADGLDVTDWQRGYRACSERVLGAVGQAERETTDG